MRVAGLPGGPKMIGDNSLAEDRIVQLGVGINESSFTQFEHLLFSNTDTFSADDISEYKNPEAKFEKQLVGLLAIENIFTAVKSSLEGEGFSVSANQLLQLLVLSEQGIEDIHLCYGSDCVAKMLRAAVQIVQVGRGLQSDGVPKTLRPFYIAAYLWSDMTHRGVITPHPRNFSELCKYVPIDSCNVQWEKPGRAMLDLAYKGLRHFYAKIIKQTQEMLCPKRC